MKSQKILIIAAHPDDEILGCGASIARFIQEGCTASTLILGDGVTSRDRYDQSEVEIRKKQCYLANEIIGIKEVRLYGLPDNRFDSVPLLNIVKKITKVIEEIKPDIIYTHDEHCLNIDHQITFRAVITATRPMSGESVKEIYSFELPSSTEWRYPLAFVPDTFIDVTSTIHQKLHAMKEYKNELREYPHPRSIQAIGHAARMWGIRTGISDAEAFKTIRKII